VRRVHISLALCLGATLLFSANHDAIGGSFSIGHSDTAFGNPTLPGDIPPFRVRFGSDNPLLLPARPGEPSVSTGWARPGLGGASSGIEEPTRGGSHLTVTNGVSTNRRYLTGTVVGVQPGVGGGARGTILIRLSRQELPVINGKHEDKPNKDVTIQVSDSTSFHASGVKGPASLADVHLGEMVCVGLDAHRFTREVDVLPMSDSGR
jgi:hypothetical protein